MNIFVLPYSHHNLKSVSIDLIKFRPDTTISKELSCWYTPSFIDSVEISIGFYIKFSKAGKAIAEKYAERYIDSGGFSILFHCKKDEFEYDILDNTTIISPPEDLKSMFNERLSFTTTCGDSELIISSLPEREDLYRAIHILTEGTSVRCGDIMIFEMSDRIRVDGEISVRSLYSGTSIFDFNIL